MVLHARDGKGNKGLWKKVLVYLTNIQGFKIISGYVIGDINHNHLNVMLALKVLVVVMKRLS